MRTSPQDHALERHFLVMMKAAGGRHGLLAANLLARIIYRAKREYGTSFVGYTARLIREDAVSQGWDR